MGEVKTSPTITKNADGLAAELDAAQQREAGLTDAVERLVVVLDRNDKRGPIPDVEMMFCWLAAQDIRAAFRAAIRSANVAE